PLSSTTRMPIRRKSSNVPQSMRSSHSPNDSATTPRRFGPDREAHTARPTRRGCQPVGRTFAATGERGRCMDGVRYEAVFIRSAWVLSHRTASVGGRRDAHQRRKWMITIGVVLLLIGLLAGIPVLWSIGV